MENPSDVASLEIDIGGLGTHGGCPTDNVIALDGTTALERSRSPSASEFQPFSKKGRCVGVSTEDQGDLDVNMGDDLSDTMKDLNGTVPSIFISSTVEAAAGGSSSLGVPTFKDKLLGSAGVVRDTVPLSDLDVDVREGDVHIGGKMVHGSRFEVLMDDVEHNDDGVTQATAINNLRTENIMASASLPHSPIERLIPHDTRPQQRSEVPARL
ncbi:hypothetical protein V6N13_047816 [Hibiscus sabdariffa]|uniref:Uncharacterized protein n=1 Tax=Hibiscus sabdariffa TaxID=183260 RepID=A0ABR2F5E1_9ROSI